MKTIALKSVLASAFLAAPFVTPAVAAETFKAQYTISAIGINVGKTSFTTTVTDKNYSVKGTMKASGFASIFSSLSGNISVAGHHSTKAAQSNAYDVAYQEGKKAKSTSLRFSGGNVSKTVNKPKRGKRDNWVEHSPGALNNVVDPITALLIAAPNDRAVCNRKLRVFDGVMRADVQLSYRRTIPFSVDGYKGTAVTCKAKFIPVSGYQTTKKDVAFMRDRSNIEISFAPMGKTGLYAPVAAKAQTRIGQIAARITSFKPVN